MERNKHYFCKLSPSGNTTVFLNAREFPEDLYAATAASLMSPLHLGAEQVGFISREGKTLRMMGGEFCVNATRAFARILAEDYFERRPGAAAYSDELSVSGADAPIGVRVLRNGFSEAMLTLSAPPRPLPLGENVYRVALPGISHIVVTGPRGKDPAEEAKELIRRHADGNDDACGCIRLDIGAMSMLPYVWVRATDTLCAETACGSGAVACAALLNSVSGAESVSLLQPSGERLDIAMRGGSGKTRIAVGGFVRFIAEGFVYI